MTTYDNDDNNNLNHRSILREEQAVIIIYFLMSYISFVLKITFGWSRIRKGMGLAHDKNKITYLRLYA